MHPPTYLPSKRSLGAKGAAAAAASASMQGATQCAGAVPVFLPRPRRSAPGVEPSGCASAHKASDDFGIALGAFSALSLSDQGGEKRSPSVTCACAVGYVGDASAVTTTAAMSPMGYDLFHPDSLRRDLRSWSPEWEYGWESAPNPVAYAPQDSSSNAYAYDGARQQQYYTVDVPAGSYYWAGAAAAASGAGLVHS